MNREQLRQQAFSDIAAMLAQGDETGLSSLRDKYQSVPKASWHRWVKSVKTMVGHIDQKTMRLDESAAIALEASEHLPAAPSPDYITTSGRASGNLDFMRELERLYEDAEKLRTFAMDEKTGRIKLPKYLAQSINLRNGLLQTTLKAMQEVWDLRRMTEFYDAVINAVAEESPECAGRIMERLKKLNAETGMTYEARI